MHWYAAQGGKNKIKLEKQAKKWENSCETAKHRQEMKRKREIKA